MKVILLKDVPNVGESGSIQNVSDGFARNYLIPQGLAEMGTPGRIKHAQERLNAQQRKIEREEEKLRGLAERIEGTRVEIVARVGKQGRLFGSITAADVATEVSKALSEEIDRRKVVLGEPIRTMGEHEVEIHLVGRLRPKVTVAVLPSEDSELEDESTEAEGSSDDSEDATDEAAAEASDEADVEEGVQQESTAGN
jgi:large subunit ribosomal protein L9